mmetsp:Transcript_77/g.172  ORF Transcript_77/g.172 Transcript_77/m.172 type:complete len:779 (+) Transcript_77:44-2380(+)
MIHQAPIQKSLVGENNKKRNRSMSDFDLSRRPTKRSKFSYFSRSVSSPALKSSSTGASDGNEIHNATTGSSDDATTHNAFISNPPYPSSAKTKIHDAYDEGMNVYSQLLQVPNREGQDNTPGLSLSATVAILFNLGQINLRRNEDEKALEFFLMASDLVTSGDRPSVTSTSIVGDEDVTSIAALTRDTAKPYRKTRDNEYETSQPSNVAMRDHIAILHNIGYIYYRQGKFELSLEQFTRICHYASESFGHLGDLSVASALNCIGVVLFHMNECNYENCKNLFLQSLNIRRILLGCGSEVDDVHVATTLNNLGRVHFASGAYTRALHYYKQSLSMRRRLLGPNHMDVSVSAFNTGQTYHKLSQLQEAIALYHEFYTSISKKHGEIHRDVAVVLKLLGQAYHENEDSMTAVEFYSRALQINRKVFGHFNQDSASILNMLGNLHYESNNFDQAIRIYEEGLAIERAVLNRKNRVNIVVTLTNIGQALMQKKDIEGALRKYTEAYSIQCSVDKKNVVKITEILSMIGQISSMLGKYMQARKAFTRVVNMRKLSLGDHIDVALALNYLGLVNFKQGALDLAMDNFKESLRIRMACCSEECNDIAVLLYNIASIYLHHGDNERALKHFQRAVSVERACLGDFHPDVMMTLKLIGKVYDHCGQYEKALDYYHQALHVYKKFSSQAADEHSSYPSISSSSSSVSLARRNNATVTKTLRELKVEAGRLLARIASVYLRQANTEEMTVAMSDAHRLYLEIKAPVDELELSGFDLYELSLLHPECAAAA